MSSPDNTSSRDQQPGLALSHGRCPTGGPAGSSPPPRDRSSTRPSEGGTWTGCWISTSGSGAPSTGASPRWP